MVPALPSSSESSMSKTAAVRWNGCMQRARSGLFFGFHLGDAALLLRLLGFLRGDLLGWPWLQGEVRDLPLGLQRPEALIQRQPARLGAHLDDHGRGGALDEAHGVELAGQDAHAPVALEVGVDAHVALLALPGRLGHADLLAAIGDGAHRSGRPFTGALRDLRGASLDPERGGEAGQHQHDQLATRMAHRELHRRTRVETPPPGGNRPPARNGAPRCEYRCALHTPLVPEIAWPASHRAAVRLALPRVSR